MSWLQNSIIVVASFLLARFMIDSNIHHRLVDIFISHSRRNVSGLITGVMGLSYLLSLFLPNTVVVLALIPVIKYILHSIPENKPKRTIATTLALALIFGANVGGMGSLIGTSLNILFLSFIEIYKVAGREQITFFSWFIYGLPGTAVLIIIGRLILKLFEKRIPLQASDIPRSEFANGKRFRRYITIFVINILFMFALTAIEFIWKPKAVLRQFNQIDLILSLYLIIFLFIAFLLPRNSDLVKGFIKNLAFVLLIMASLPFIIINESFKEMSIRLRWKNKHLMRNMDALLVNSINSIWYPLFREKISNLKRAKPSSVISINKLVYDLPFTGLLFMAAIFLVVYLILKIGDNPDTAQFDGLIINYVENISTQTLVTVENTFVLLAGIIFITIFLTEFLNNTTTAIILYPIVLNVGEESIVSPLILLLAITIASTGSFMTPIATPVNAITFGGIPGVSLKKMVSAGLLFNISGGLLLAAFFYFLGIYYTP